MKRKMVGQVGRKGTRKGAAGFVVLDGQVNLWVECREDDANANAVARLTPVECSRLANMLAQAAAASLTPPPKR